MRHPTRLDGFKAAGLIIFRELERAEKRAPKRQVKPRTGAYQAGLRDGLLFAHCQMVLGDFPEANTVAIEKVMKSRW